MDHQPRPVHRLSPSDDKVALFRSLFRGRGDVYPRRFESRRTGKSGYAPACANEWVPGICEKPRIKCINCPHRRFLPVTDEVVRWHLSGHDDGGQDFVMGVYPMLLDETTFLLAVDFDKAGWRDDAAAFVETCRRKSLPVALERSRSGQGAHAWLFFEEAIPATLARKLGSFILTETMERRPDLGLDSYDRFFPNQDTLPQGGFGNLIALPLQKRPREAGNSLFLDDRLEPYSDQWAFLSSMRRLDRADVERAVHDAENEGRVLAVRMAPTEDGPAPWEVPPSRRPRSGRLPGPLPNHLEVVLSNEIYIAKDDMPPALRNRLLRLAAFQNPEFYKAQAMRLPTYDKPRIIACAEDHGNYLGLPRGCLEDVLALLSSLKIDPVVRDERFCGDSLDVTFQGELRPDQSMAAKAMLAHETGVLSATTAFGKTVVASWLIAQRGVNALVLVHRRQLLQQWIERLSAFLALPQHRIGRIAGGRRRPTGRLDVALIQSLTKKGVVDDIVGDYGHIVVDECHHLSAQSFEQVARRSKARFVIGLSATTTRKDGRHPIIFMHCGPVRYHVDAKRQAASRPFEHAVHVRPTAFTASEPKDPDSRVRFNELCRELMSDDARNRLICNDVVDAVRMGRWPLVLTERNGHLDSLQEMLAPRVAELIVLRGGMTRKQLQHISARLAESDASPRVVLATGRFVGEGFDDARLDTLFLALPVSWRGTIAQYVGRLHRLCEHKREVRVYDYADLDVSMLSRMFDRRCRGYEAVGYTVLLPASATPGWPSDVPLPVESRWKQDHAASVRRLVRDGVGTPLADLFAQATLPPSPGAQGAHRARSATERFVYMRLETLPETSGRFTLNAKLPVAFDGWSQMEVDLLCADARLAIELDGPQHLSDPEAYRRDRRKDARLQEQGYFVLRFLAEDVGTRLDAILDAILRVLASRRSASSKPFPGAPRTARGIK